MDRQITQGKLLGRVFMAIFYDSLVISSLLLIATLVVTIELRGAVIPSSNIAFKFFLFLLIYSFFMYFWLRFGQTTGMRAWKIKLVSLNNQPINFYQANLRFFISFFSYFFLGFGVLMRYFNKDKLMLHDILSGTKITRINYV